MLRRSFIALSALLMANRIAQAQTAPKDNPRSATPTDAVLNFQSAIDQVVNIAYRVEDDAEKYLRNVLAAGREKIDAGHTTLAQIPAAVVPDVIIFERNASKFILAVLEKSKDAEGRVVVTVISIENTIKSFCPLYPFC